MEFCAELLVDSTTRSIFDDVIYEIEPQLTQMVIDFTEEAWKMLLFPYPKFAAQRLYSRREVIYKTLVRKAQHRSYSCSSGRTCAKISGICTVHDVLTLLQSEFERI